MGDFPNPQPVIPFDGLTNTQLRASAVPVTGTFTPSGTLDVNVTNASLAVTGTFWQATQPISGSVSISGAVAVTGTFWQATQPVSIASMPSTPVTGTFWQATQPVSGTFWQATQPVSGSVSITGSVTVTGGLTDSQLRATPVPVSGTVAVTGTFWQSTQPVSIAASVAVTGPLTDTQLRATPVPVSGTVTANTGLTQPLTDTQLRLTPVPVSGTFWQSTQPVSIASMPSTPVTGTFWQSTQPVSIAASVAVTGPLTDTQLRATPVPVSGTVTANTGLTQPLTDTQLRATPVPVSGTVAVTGTFWQTTQPVSGTFWQTTQPVSGTFWQSTQPVSIASMPSTPVTGTFWQSTQPVSVAATLNVTTDLQTKVTYTATVARVSTGALTANTLLKVLSFEHAGASTKTMRLRSLLISGYATSATAGTVEFQLFRGTAASSGGSAITPTPLNPGDAAADTVVKSLPTIVAATVLLAGNVIAVPATANSSIGQAFEFLPPLTATGGKSFTLRASNLDGIALSIISTAAITVTLNITATFTEE